MKPIFPRLAASGLLIFLLAACNLPQEGTTGPDTGTVSTKVALTLAALTQSAQPGPLASPASPTVTTAPASPTLTTAPVSPTAIAPTYTPIPTLPSTATVGPTRTPVPPPGLIAGNISGYPYGSVPSLAIVGFQQEAPYNDGFIITVPGQTYFVNNSSYLLPGHYQVVAYDSSGHTGGCSVIVVVVSKQTVNCDITNWGGGYPDKPSFVPNP